MATPFETITISKDTTDADLFRQLRRTSRAASGGALLIDGDLSAPLSGAAKDWIVLLLTSDSLPVVIADGPVGGRGFALLLLADRAWTGTNVKDAGQASALPELAQIRLGPLAARRLAYSDAPVEFLHTLGQCEASDSPSDTAHAWLKGLLRGDNAQRLRKGWRAAQELPAEEALDFGAWLDRSDLQETH